MMGSPGKPVFVAVMGLLLAAHVSAAPEGSFDLDQVVTLLEFVIEADEDTAVECLGKVIQQANTGELNREQLAALRTRLSKTLQPSWRATSTKPLHDAALQLAALWGETEAVAEARRILGDATQPPERRGVMLTTLAATGDPTMVRQVSAMLANPKLDPALESASLIALAKFDTVDVGDTLIHAYPRLSSDAQAKSITLLTQRSTWSRQLVEGVKRGEISPTVVGVNHLRTLLASRDKELRELVQKQWGSVRTERSPEREQVMTKMRQMLTSATGDAARGQIVFQRVCGQCHKIHGVGQEVGPDITSNGRSSFDQLLSNVFDPSLVIGPAYQAVTVVTTEGRVLTGLLAEDSEQRISLKTQGGKIETIARDEVEEVAPSKLSLMPENLEQQLKPEELADLFAFLVLDKPPHDPEAKQISGAPTFGENKR